MRVWLLCTALVGCSPLPHTGTEGARTGNGAANPDTALELLSRVPLNAALEHASQQLLIYASAEQSGIQHQHRLRYSEADRWLDDFGGGMAALDCDLDGDLDLFFTVSDGPDLLYLNDGLGHFTLSQEFEYSSASSCSLGE